MFRSMEFFKVGGFMFGGLLLMTAFQNCEGVKFQAVAQSAVADVTPTSLSTGSSTSVVAPVPVSSPDSTICNSFSGAGTSCNLSQSFVGYLYIEPRASLITTSVPYSNGAVSGATSAEGYIAHPEWMAGSSASGTFVPYTVAMSTINSIGVAFATGFATESGAVVQVPDTSGNYTNVPNWFALDLFGHFHLNSSDAPGVYQFAVVADDGAEVFYQPNASSGYVKLVDDQITGAETNGAFIPGTQYARMGCAASAGDTTKIITLSMDATSSVPLEIRYYNGPIGLSFRLMYRKVPAAGPVDAYCETDTNGDPSTKPSVDRASPVLDNSQLTSWQDITSANLASK